MSCRDGWGRTAIILSIWFIVEVPGNRGLPVTKGREGGTRCLISKQLYMQALFMKCFCNTLVYIVQSVWLKRLTSCSASVGQPLNNGQNACPQCVQCSTVNYTCYHFSENTSGRPHVHPSGIRVALPVVSQELCTSEWPRSQSWQGNWCQADWRRRREGGGRGSEPDRNPPAGGGIVSHGRQEN